MSSPGTKPRLQRLKPGEQWEQCLSGHSATEAPVCWVVFLPMCFVIWQSRYQMYGMLWYQTYGVKWNPIHLSIKQVPHQNNKLKDKYVWIHKKMHRKTNYKFPNFLTKVEKSGRVLHPTLGHHTRPLNEQCSLVLSVFSSLHWLINDTFST